MIAEIAAYPSEPGCTLSYSDPSGRPQSSAFHDDEHDEAHDADTDEETR